MHSVSSVGPATAQVRGRSWQSRAGACPHLNAASNGVWGQHRTRPGSRSRFARRAGDGTAGGNAGTDHSEPSSSSSSGSITGIRRAPWNITFDLRERETIWTEQNQARLVRLVTAYDLGLELEAVEQRLADLQVLLPQLGSRVAYIKPATLAGLIRDPGALVPRLITLRQLLPTADISQIAAAEPELLLLRDLGQLQADLERLRQLLGDEADVDAVVQAQPRATDAELVSEVLEELRRLMPKADPVRMLLADPSWLLRVERGTKRLGEHPDSGGFIPDSDFKH